jgi:hypothetical protein
VRHRVPSGFKRTLLVTCRSVTSQLVTCHTSRFVKQAPENERDYYHRKLLVVVGETQVLETRVIILSEN